MIKALDLKLREEVMDSLRQYIEQIRNLNIDHIGYREFFDDGTSMAFCSKKEWYDVAPYSDEMSADMSIHYAMELISLNKNGFDYIIRAISAVNNRFLEQLLLQDMCNSLLIYRREKKVIKMYSFITSKKNISAINYFFNKKDLLESFVELYKDKLAFIFRKDEYRELRRPLFSNKVINSIFVDNNLSKERIIFTPREEECIALLIKGANDKNIAAHFNISPRTASYHVMNIKKKLKVNSRFDIIKVIKNNLLKKNIYEE